MKKRKKLLKVVLGISLFSLMGCSSIENTSKVTLEVFNNKSENQQIMQTFIDEYEEKNPDIDIVLSSPPDAGTVLRTRLVKNDIPNIISYGGDITYTELANVGMLEDLSKERFVDNIVPAYKEITQDLQKDKTKLYGVPYATNASGVIYNKELFEKYQIETPKTWDEFIKICQFFESKDITPIEATYKDAWTLSSVFNPLSGILADESLMEKRKENKATLSKGWVETLEKLSEVMTYTQKDAMGTGYADGTQAFAKGKAAMLINGTWAIPEVQKANPEMKVNIFALPASNDVAKNKVTSGVDVMLMIGKDTKNQKEAKAFIEFLLEKEQAQRYVDQQFAFSAQKGIKQTDPTLSGISPMIEAGKVNDFIDHFLPNGYDLPPLLSEFALEEAKGKNQTDKNIKKTLKKMDEAYDAANID
ncbi:extracellular solute-binding protein [Vagococcus carniphilus]|uniref:Extracellular solute-binding protein n=1 Tax=Vagococcus carniphilus TaxID=218144 RepID=A0AAW8UDR4_9ENTE|nr:extracellular solute-binding protein [Vagococcus carniphilus]MDT2835058.1 extracellular solute-binding protein [Vagococcus carniphilus]